MRVFLRFFALGLLSTAFAAASAQTPIPDSLGPLQLEAGADAPVPQAVIVTGLDGDKIFGEDGIKIQFGDDFGGPAKVLVKSPLSTVWQDVTDAISYDSQMRTIILAQSTLSDFFAISGANSVAELSIFQSQDQEEPDYSITFSSGPTRAEICETAGRHGLRKAFYDLLGQSPNCRVTEYEHAEFGTYKTIVLEWPGIELTTKFSPPETAVFRFERFPRFCTRAGLV